MALAAYTKINTLEQLIKPRQVEQGVDTRDDTGAKARNGRRAHAAGGARTGHVDGVDAACGSETGRVGLHTGLEAAEHSAVSALLRAKHVGGTPLAHERVCHVGHDGKRRRRHTGVKIGHVHVLDTAQVPTIPLKFRAECVTEHDAERTQGAHATIVGCAAPQGKDDLIRATIEGRANELAESVGRGVLGIALQSGNKGEARRSGQLDDCPAVLEHAECCLDGVA